MGTYKKIVLFVIKKYAKTLLFSLLIINSIKGYTQSDTTDIYDLTLSELSKLKIASVSKAMQNISEIPSTIYIITSAEIREKGYFTLEEALSDLPGFQFRNTLGQNSYVFQRGIPNQNNLTLLLIDGVQVNELNSGGFYGGGQYNLSNVDHIEVLYGPASVTYGTNAVSGIINIVTKNCLEKKLELNSWIGNFSTSGSDFSYSNVNKKKTLGFSVAGMFKKSDKANLKNDAGDNNWTDLMDNYENDYTLDMKSQYKEFTWGINYILKQTSLATNNKSIGTIYKDYGTQWNIQFINSYGKYQKQFSKKLSLSAVLYNRNATVLSNTVYNVVDTAQVGYYRPNNQMGLENVLNYTPGKIFSLTSGITLKFEQLSKQASFSHSDSPEIKPPRPSNPVMVNGYLLSVFAEPRLTLFKNLYISGGLRYDQSSVYEEVFTPCAGISYHLKKQIIRVSYSEAFRSPQPWDFTDGLGNPSLKPEKMKSLELAFSFSIIDKIKIEVTGYKNYLINSISKEILDTIGHYIWANSGKINTYGFEVFFKFETGKFKSAINYTYTQSENVPGNFINEISKHCGNASLTYAFNDNLKINLRANYVGKRKNPKLITVSDSYFVDPYIVLQGAISFINYKGLTAQIAVKNLLNAKYYHTSNRDVSRYRQPQVTIFFTIGYSIFK